MQLPPSPEPRVINPARTFNSLVSWVHDIAAARNAPGMMVGISGTDSALAFLICAAAFEKLGKPGRVAGIHFGPQFPPPNKTDEEVAKILTLAPSFNWVARTLVPWLQERAPYALVEVDSSINYHSDHQRWATLFERSLSGADSTQPLTEGQNYWIAGTRNATEQALGTYSNISGGVSLQPLVHLWKSEVLQLCEYLSVPKIAMERSRQVDCDCGRFDLAAEHITEVDHLLMARQELLSPRYAEETIEPELRQRLEAFIDEQIEYARFKNEIPYTPMPEVVI